MFIFCNPHNPVGRVWTEDEIAKLGAICAKHNVIVVSDEIHSDLIMPGHKHVAFANACKDALPKYLVCTAPSKTFNLATLQTSNIVIPDEELRTNSRVFYSNTSRRPPVRSALRLPSRLHGVRRLACRSHRPYLQNYKNFCKFIDVNCPGVTYSDLQARTSCGSTARRSVSMMKRSISSCASMIFSATPARCSRRAAPCIHV